MDLAFFSFQKFELFLLVLVRTLGIFTLTPLFGSRQVPVHLRIATSLAMAFVFVSIVPVKDELPMELPPLALMVIREACIGLVIGFVCVMIFAAVEIAGGLIDLNSGLAFATMIDPVYGSNSAIAGRFQSLVVGLLFFAVNGHHILIRGLVDSFDLAPIGELSMNPAIAGGMTDLFVSLFIIGVRIAFPVMAAVFLADVVFAIIARVVPQVNILIVGFPLKLGVGIAGMIIALPVLFAMSNGLFGDMYGHIGSMVQLFGTQ